jgi:hypothetical protein
MTKNAWMREQAAAADALVKFIRDHGSEPDPELRACLDALQAKDIDAAVRHALRVKPHGMGGLTDWWPPVKYPNEDENYVHAVLRALVNEWCRLMALSFEGKIGGRPEL